MIETKTEVDVIVVCDGGGETADHALCEDHYLELLEDERKDAIADFKHDDLPALLEEAYKGGKKDGYDEGFKEGESSAS